MLGGVRRRAPSGVAGQVLDAPGVALIARILLTSPFWISAGFKAIDLRATSAEVAQLELQPAALIAGLIIVVQAAGSASVILGRRAWLGAASLAAFTLLASVIGHPFWAEADQTASWHQTNAVVANMGLIGGLVLSAALQQRDR